MLLGPVAIDPSTPHSAEGALHANCADVDVADDQTDHEQGNGRVQGLHDLHSRVTRPEEWKHHSGAGYREREPTQPDRPKDEPLPRIELPRWRSLALRST